MGTAYLVGALSALLCEVVTAVHGAEHVLHAAGCDAVALHQVVHEVIVVLAGADRAAHTEGYRTNGGVRVR